jgi:PP-loop superfamily ATP-utilizing enzyme
MSTRLISYGGGVQSTALLVLAAQGKIDFQYAVFANVGEDSEHPSSLEYVENIAKPYAAANGIELVEVRRTDRYGNETETLRERLVNTEHRALGIPVRMSNGAPASRTCTSEYKIKVVAKWAKKMGATKADPAIVAIGISTDEMQRANNRQPIPYEVIEYPLLDLGINRGDCQNIIADAGLPIPPKSSCYFCPFHRINTWREMRRDEPELFAKSVELEQKINNKRTMLGMDHVWLSDRLRPLDEAITEAQEHLPFEASGPEGCDEGYCWT